MTDLDYSWVGTVEENGWQVQIRPKVEPSLSGAFSFADYDKVVWDPVAENWDGDRALAFIKHALPDHEVTMTRRTPMADPDHIFEGYDANPHICRHCGAVAPMPCYPIKRRTNEEKPDGDPTT